MVIENIPNSAINSLYREIDANMSSFKKRSLGYIINAQSDTIATIIVNVTGKKGTVSKSCVLIFDILSNEWNMYCDGKKYIFVQLNEISSIIRNMISQLSTIATKFS